MIVKPMELFFILKVFLAFLCVVLLYQLWTADAAAGEDEDDK